jgi:serine/threonine-protein kinase HipA
MPEREIEVWLWAPAGRNVRVGTVWAHERRGVQSQTFAYAPGYLSMTGAYALEPTLPLTSASQQTALGLTMFGAFADSSPDRWGRQLIARAERRRARRTDSAERRFTEVDYLLGARDDLRQGALRLRRPGEPAFLAPAEAGVPALMQLGDLLAAAERSERDMASDEDLRMLLHGGSSLGGARPKAHVLDAAGNLAIAKFPSTAKDEWDVIRWEAVALTLAGRAGIQVPPFQLQSVGGRPVLIVRRFDRNAGRRTGYISAMTMLGMRDGETGSYLEIAEAITRSSPAAGRDLREMWRRMCFTVLISNYDDHLRNHGFIRAGASGWSLAPAFDLNPDPRPGARLLSTAVDFDNTDADIGLVLDVASEFRLSPAAARDVLSWFHRVAGLVPSESDF